MKMKGNIDEIRSRAFKMMLYADNKQHMQAFKKIQRDSSFRDFFCAAWHVVQKDGKEIVQGTDKKHLHLVFDFPNPRYWGALCRSLGVDSQFLQAMKYKMDGTMEKNPKRYTVQGGYIYLLHLAEPDKEHYPLSALFGSPDKVADAKAAILDWQMRHITLSESLRAIREWVISQYGQIITPANFVQWVTGTPYVRTASNPWVRQLIDSHNNAVWASQSRNYLDDIISSYGRFAVGAESAVDRYSNNDNNDEGWFCFDD